MTMLPSAGHTANPTAKIIPFPARVPAPREDPVRHLAIGDPLAPRLAAAVSTELGRRGQWCGVLYVARQLRLEAVELRTVVAHIRAHVANSGFPPPASSRLRHGVPLSGAEAVTPKSEWLRASVDGWVAARDLAGLSPEARAAAQAERAAQVDATLAARLGRCAPDGQGGDAA